MRWSLDSPFDLLRNKPHSLRSRIEWRDFDTMDYDDDAHESCLVRTDALLGGEFRICYEVH